MEERSISNMKTPLQIHNEMFEKYRKDMEWIGNLTVEEVGKLAPEVTPFHEHKKTQKIEE